MAWETYYKEEIVDSLRKPLWGVSTKHLQNYLNWFKVKETILKTAQDQAADLFKQSMENVNEKGKYTQNSFHS